MTCLIHSSGNFPLTCLRVYCRMVCLIHSSGNFPLTCLHVYCRMVCFLSPGRNSSLSCFLVYYRRVCLFFSMQITQSSSFSGRFIQVFSIFSGCVSGRVRWPAGDIPACTDDTRHIFFRSGWGDDLHPDEWPDGRRQHTKFRSVRSRCIFLS